MGSDEDDVIGWKRDCDDGAMRSADAENRHVRTLFAGNLATVRITGATTISDIGLRLMIAPDA